MRQRRCPQGKHLLALVSLSACFWIGTPASAQSMPAQDRDTTNRELGSFDSFMDGHPEIAEQLRKDPSLVQEKTFVANHPDLQKYLQDHPGVNEEIRENPDAFMHQEEQRSDRRGDFRNRDERRELTNLDGFLDSHPEIAEQLRKDPSLVNSKEFVAKHPALQEFLQGHGELAQELRQNPNGFMNQEERFDQRGDVRDRDEHREMANMDRFLDGHPEIAEQLRKDPSLVNNKEFVAKHPALQEFLQGHGELAQELRQNPNGFMNQEERFDQRGDLRDRDEHREMANMDRFLDGHPEIAEQLRKDPSLVNNKEFNAKHPALQEFLQGHGELAQELRQNPNAFMNQEQRFDRRDDSRDRDFQRGQLASMDQFLDGHPEIAEQLRKNPALLNDKKFVNAHPALQSYLQQHPQVRQEAIENPNAFMHQEQRFDHQGGFGQNGQRFDHDTQRGELANFGQFLGGHENIAQQISKNPSLVNNAEYMENHPELKAYLRAHPGVQEELKENPQALMQSVQQQAGKAAPKGSALAHPQEKQY